MVYFYFRPNMHLAAGGVILWDPSGSDIYDCLYWDWDPCQPFPDGAEMYEFTLRNGLSARTIELQRAYGLSYRGWGCELDLTWTAFMEPQPMTVLDPTKLNPAIDEWIAKDGVGDLSIGHYHQGGRVSGACSLQGETIEIDAFSNRDHSWGPRPLRDYPRASYGFAHATEETSFQFYAVSDLPYQDDPILETTERIVSGWYLKEGVRGNLSNGRLRVTQRDEDGRPLHAIVKGEDHLGRAMQAEASCRNALRWTGYNDFFCWWCLAEWEFEGVRCWGEYLDYWRFRLNRQFVQAQSGR